MRYISFYIVVLLTAFVPFAYADKVSQYKPPQSFEASDDFYVIEGAGLYQGADSRALGQMMWDNSERAEITKLLIDMPVNSKSPALQALIKGVLLSEAVVTELENYDAITPGQDLLTLRIMKLMQGGYFKEAIELYSVAVETPHHDYIAKAGILAMMGNGEKSIACLEIKTLGNMNMSDSFWPAMIAYCNYTLSSKPAESSKELLQDSKYEILRILAFNENFIFPYDTESFDKLSLLERTALVAEGRIEAPVITKENVSDIPPNHIQALLSLKALPTQARGHLLIEGIEWGVVSPDILKAFYKEHKDDNELLGGLPALYDAVDKADEEARTTLIKQAIAKEQEFGIVALLPFVDFIVSQDISDISPREMSVIAELSYQTGRDLPVESVENYLSKHEENSENEQYYQSLRIINALQYNSKGYNLDEIMQNIGVFHKNAQDSDDFVIENLDTDDADDDNADKAYEKDSNLAEQKKSDSGLSETQLKRIKRTSDAQALGETALLSIYLLHGEHAQDFDETLYNDNIDALKNANLEEFSRKKALERLIRDEDII